jgi:hypothetical protein
MSVFNGARFLDEAVTSIRRQSYRDFEFIIIDDGSTDATTEILSRHAVDDVRLRVVRQENRGLIESLNRGFAEASGTYIARMDADDVAKPYRLKMQLDCLSANPGITLVGGAIEIVDSEARVLDTIRFSSEPEDLKRHMREVGNAVAHPTVLFRRSVLKEVGGFRMAYLQAEDYDLWLRMLDRFALTNLDKVLLGYRRHEGTVSYKNPRQQGLSALCARTTARLRLEGRPDPTSDIDLVTEGVLQDLGVSQEVIGEAIFTALVTVTEDCIRCGVCSAAAEFARAAQPYVSTERLRNKSLELNRKAAATRSSFSEKRRHRRMLLTSDPAAYWAIFRPGTWSAEAEARSPKLMRLQADSSTWIDHNAESPASCHAGGKAGDGEQSPAQGDAERVDCAEALAAAHKRIADLEREVLELRLSYSQNAVTQKEREAN